jgi:hypothetical protein
MPDAGCRMLDARCARMPVAGKYARSASNRHPASGIWHLLKGIRHPLKGIRHRRF